MLGEGSPARRPDPGLRVRAEDAEDLAVISACLQDALVSVRDLAYDRDRRTFVLVANRFRWEEGGSGRARAPRQRILCGVQFDGVENVVYRGFHRSEEDRILALLAICPTPAGPGATIDLEFAAGATIRLIAPAIRCRARDFGEPWPTRWRPGHPVEEPR
jgi:Protein of unknown function (DUF2948)